VKWQIGSSSSIEKWQTFMSEKQPSSASRYDRLADLFYNMTQAESGEKAVLVVGAGKGDEVLALKRHFTSVKGIEINMSQVVPEAKPAVEEGDATRMHFVDESFDILYCYHVLEHIPEPLVALQEMKRVLKKGGILYVGVPNKLRLFSYVFVKEETLWTRLLWNFKDYKARLLGRFENRYGAHAGFTSLELGALLKGVFSNVREVTRQYYTLKYPGSGLVQSLLKMSSLEFIWPSIYFICRK